MLNVFHPFDVLNPKELKPSVMAESKATKIFTMVWHSPYVKMSDRKLEVFMVPLREEASPFRLATQLPTVTSNGTIQVSLSGFLEMLGNAKRPYLLLCLGSYTDIEFHVDWLQPTHFLVPTMLDRVAITQVVRSMPSTLNIVPKQYASNEWNMVFGNMFERLNNLQTNLSGSSEIKYQRQYFEREQIHSDMTEAVKSLSPVLSALEPRSARFYNHLFWDTVELSLGADNGINK